jgi:Zn finger protein HypA/HybF involved in hydrogenase expression
MTGDEGPDRSGSAEGREAEGEAALVVVRCDSCGNTFPIHEGDDTGCPECGSAATHPATEPLL